MPDTASMSPVQINDQAMSCLNQCYWESLVLQARSCATERGMLRGRATTHERTECLSDSERCSQCQLHRT